MPRAVAFEHRIAAAVADPGVVRVGDSWRAPLPEVMTQLLDQGDKADFDAFMEAGLKDEPAQLAALKWRMAPYGTDSFYDAYVAAQRMHLDEATLARITCPLLVASPDHEQFWPGQSDGAPHRGGVVDARAVHRGRGRRLALRAGRPRAAGRARLRLAGGRPGPLRPVPRPLSAARGASRRLVAALVVAVLVAVVVASCSASADRRAVEGEIESRTDQAFYEVPSPLPDGKPGDLIRSEDLLGAPDGARAWRILYHSRDVTGAAIAVSGVVVAPVGDEVRGERPIVSWGHPTTGAAQHCAPSLGVDPFDTIEGLRDLLRAGYVVVATDYSGMGAAGPDSYLIGTSEGRSVLDAARAARAIPDSGAGSRLLLWGHSQGGQAVLFAAQDAQTYAPELELVAVAVAAPAVELGALLDDDIVDDSGVTLGAYSFQAYSSVYGPTTPGLDLTSIVTPEGIAAIPQMAELCLFGQHGELHAVAGPLVGKFLKADPSTVAPWSDLLEQNTAGASPIGVPMLVAQGEADALVEPATTQQYVAPPVRHPRARRLPHLRRHRPRAHRPPGAAGRARRVRACAGRSGHPEHLLTLPTVGGAGAVGVRGVRPGGRPTLVRPAGYLRRRPAVTGRAPSSHRARGVPTMSIDPATTAVVLIEYQNDFTTDGRRAPRRGRGGDGQAPTCWPTPAGGRRRRAPPASP